MINTIKLRRRMRNDDDDGNDVNGAAAGCTTHDCIVSARALCARASLLPLTIDSRCAAVGVVVCPTAATTAVTVALNIYTTFRLCARAGANIVGERVVDICIHIGGLAFVGERP